MVGRIPKPTPEVARLLRKVAQLEAAWKDAMDAAEAAGKKSIKAMKAARRAGATLGQITAAANQLPTKGGRQTFRSGVQYVVGGQDD